jgi:hypothetical protein
MLIFHFRQEIFKWMINQFKLHKIKYFALIKRKNNKSNNRNNRNFPLLIKNMNKETVSHKLDKLTLNKKIKCEHFNKN